MKTGKKKHTEPGAEKKGGDDAAEKVVVGDSIEEPRPVRRTFPGPRGADAPLRVAAERQAFADVVGHAKESLNAEICGVLAGQVCEDDEGLFVHVQAAIRGAAAKEANARVTFTQETWNTVHETLERDYPKLRMVGWYHSHPGFGVEFSEMDVFIQKNFFPSPTQIALVTDPLGGDTAICRNAEQGVSYLDRFWVDGREHALRAVVPPGAKESKPGTAGSTAPERDVRSIEERLGQLIQAVDDQRASFHRFLTTLLMLACVGMVVAVGYIIYSGYVSRNEPPRVNNMVPVPVQVGDKTVMLGVGIVQWTVPPELNAILLQIEKEKQAAEKAAAEKAAKDPKAPAKPKAQSPPPAKNPAPPTTTAPAQPTDAPKNP